MSFAKNVWQGRGLFQISAVIPMLLVTVAAATCPEDNHRVPGSLSATTNLKGKYLPSALPPIGAEIKSGNDLVLNHDGFPCNRRFSKRGVRYSIMKRKGRLLIADNHRIMADAYKHLLEPELQIVGIVTDGKALLDSVQELEPDGVILETILPHLNCFDAADSIKSSSSSPKLVFVTANCDPHVAAEAFRHGASAYVLKQSGAEEFRRAIRAAMDGKSYLSELIARETVHYLLYGWPKGGPKKSISPRQAEILQLLAEGNSMKVVADTLTISPATVACHKYRIMKQLRIDSNAKLMLYAIEKHMIPGRPHTL